MKLYRSLGRVWTGTQADAKAAQGGKDFEEKDVPTDKAGLMAFLNEMEARLTATAAPAAVSATEPDDEPAAIPDDAEGVRHATSRAPTNPDDCPACARSKRTAKVAANSSAAISIKADLEDVTDLRSLTEIIRLASARKAALQGTEA